MIRWRLIVRWAKALVPSGAVVFVVGCNLLLETPAPTVPADTIYTQAAQTIMAQLTLSAPAPTLVLLPTATSLPVPPATLPPTDTPTASPSPMPSATPPTEPVYTATQIPKVLFSDDFSTDTGWYTVQGEDYGFELTDGGYEIYVNMLSSPIWSIRERDISDVILQVDANKLTGAADAYFGVVCRHKDHDNYYALVISADGSYGIAKSEDGEFNFLQTGMAPQGVIHSGEAVNQVRGRCVSDALALVANDVTLIEVNDEDFESGYIGLIAGTRLSGGVSVLFDNFTVLRP